LLFDFVDFQNLVNELVTDKVRFPPAPQVKRAKHPDRICQVYLTKSGLRVFGFCPADVDLTDPHWKRRAYNDMDAYGHSKLAELLYAFELAEQWKEEGVRVVALHPGWGDSELFRSAPEGAIDRDAWRQLGMLSLEDAAQVHLHCALSEEIENGKFYSQIGVYGNPSMQGGGLPMEFVSPNFTSEKQKAVVLKRIEL